MPLTRFENTLAEFLCSSLVVLCVGQCRPNSQWECPLIQMGADLLVSKHELGQSFLRCTEQSHLIKSFIVKPRWRPKVNVFHVHWQWRQLFYAKMEVLLVSSRGPLVPSRLLGVWDSFARTAVDGLLHVLSELCFLATTGVQIERMFNYP